MWGKTNELKEAKKSCCVPLRSSQCTHIFHYIFSNIHQENFTNNDFCTTANSSIGHDFMAMRLTQRTTITWFSFTVTSDSLPFLIKVHKLGHIIGQGHGTHATGRVSLSVQKYHWHWDAEQVATVYLTCMCTTPKVQLNKILRKGSFHFRLLTWNGSL